MSEEPTPKSWPDKWFDPATLNRLAYRPPVSNAEVQARVNTLRERGREFLISEAAAATVALQRTLKSLAKVAPLQALAVLRELRVHGDEWVSAIVADARRHDVSWSVIGNALGVSRQAAQQRYGGTA